MTPNRVTAVVIASCSLVALCGVYALSAQPRGLINRPTVMSVSLSDQSLRLASFRAHDPYQAVITVFNDGPDIVDVFIEPGTVLASSSGSEPDLVVWRALSPVRFEDRDLTSARPIPVSGDSLIEPERHKHFLVETLSLEYYRNEHWPGSQVEVTGVDRMLDNLLGTIRTLEPEPNLELVQLAVWSLTDGVTARDVGDVTVEDLFRVRFWLDRCGCDLGKIPLYEAIAAADGDRERPAWSGSVRAQLLDVSRALTVDEVWAPAGKQFVVCTLQLLNMGPEPVDLSARDFRLRDRSGQWHEVHPQTTALGNGFPSLLRLGAGRRHTRRLVYAVPVGTDPYAIVHHRVDRYFECRETTP